MRADRLLSLLMLLQSGGRRMKAEELAEELEVSVRTIYRDIDALSYSGVPVVAEGGPGGGYSLLDSWRTDLSGLSPAETEALFLLSLPGPLADLEITRHLKSALLKLSSALPERSGLTVESVRQRLFIDTEGWFRQNDETPYLKELQDAVWNDRVVMVGYSGRTGRETLRRAEPYALVTKSGLWYLVCNTEKGMRVFRISRIKEVRILEEGFTRKGDFSLELFWPEWCASFKSSLRGYTVRLRFSSEGMEIAARLNKGMERLFSGQTPDPEGGITVDIDYNNIDEATGQILPFGSLVKVLEPRELRDRILRQAKRMTELYESGEKPV